MGCQGDPIKYSDIMPPELQAIRKKVAAYTSGKLGTTATPLPEGFQVSAGVNPLQTNAANIMNMLMGGGAMGTPNYNTAPGGYGGRGSGGNQFNNLPGTIRPSNPGNPPPGTNPNPPGTITNPITPGALRAPSWPSLEDMQKMWQTQTLPRGTPTYPGWPV